MSDFFRNPELMRHVRAELRAPRMLLSAGLALAICILISAFHSQMMAEHYRYSQGPPEFTSTLFFWLVCMQAVILPMWCLSTTLQAIAGERQMKTYDFVRTTRLTSSELLIGYVLGSPIMAYFTVGVTIIIAILAGLGEHVPLGAMLITYVLLLVLSLFFAMVGLCVSMMIEKPRSAGLLFVLLFFGWPFSALSFVAAQSPFPGFAALGVIPGLVPLFKNSIYLSVTNMPFSAPVFGIPIPLFVITILLYASMGAWIFVALKRNLKKEREEIRLFSNRQAIGFAAYLNLLLLAFLTTPPGDSSWGQAITAVVPVAFLSLNYFLFYAVGFSTLSPPERLKVWYRSHAHDLGAYLSDNALPWPWMVVAAVIAYFTFVVIAVSSRAIAPVNAWPVKSIAVSVAVLLAFAVRDILFLQWCATTRMKSPIAKGVGLIWLYYLAASIASASPNSGYHRELPPGFAFLTPAGAFAFERINGYVIAGLAAQCLLIGLLLYLINERVNRKATVALATA